MKKILIFLAIISFTIISCEKDESLNSNYKITKYAVFEYDPVFVTALGGAFTPAAVAKIEGKVVPFKVEGTVNTSVAGIYDVTYVAVNEDGFKAEAIQKVIVHNPAIVGTDVSGAIVDVNRPARTGVITLVPGTTSIFYCTDFAFAGVFPMYFQMNGDTISEISQVYESGVTSVDLTYDPVTRRFTTTVNPQGFGYTFKYQ